MIGMYGTTRGFQPRAAQRPAQNQPTGPSVGTGVSQQQQQQIAGAVAPGTLQTPTAPQGPLQSVPATRFSNVQNAGMYGSAAGRVAGIMNSQPDQGGVVAGNQVAPAAQAPGLPPGVDLNDPKNAALAGYMAQ